MKGLKQKIEKIRELEGEKRIHIRNLYMRASHRERFKVIMGLLAEYTPNTCFLDIGCAEGLYCGIAKIFGAKRIVGIDISGKKLERARKTFLCEFYKFNCEENLKPFYNNFDFVLCSEVLQHVIDYQKTVEELIKCVRGNGYILISTSNLAEGKHEFANINASMSVKRLLGEVGGAGYGGKKAGSIWKFNTSILERELVNIYPLTTVKRIAISTPDREIKELFTVFLFKCERDKK